MREIKFRAKTIRAGKWSKWIIGSLDFTKYTYQEARIVGYDDPVQYWHKIDKNTIGQYTGLKDKNGVEIYEGDVVRGVYYKFSNDEHGHKGFKEQIAKVLWNSELARFDFEVIKNNEIEMPEDYTGEIYQIVIGNIYDNPELLGKEQA